MNANNYIPPTSLITAASFTGCAYFSFWLGRQFPMVQPLDPKWFYLISFAGFSCTIIHCFTWDALMFLTAWPRRLESWQSLPYAWRLGAAAYSLSVRTALAWIQTIGLSILALQHVIRAGLKGFTGMRTAFADWKREARAEFAERINEAAVGWLVQAAGAALSERLLLKSAAQAEVIGYPKLAKRYRRMAALLVDFQ